MHLLKAAAGEFTSAGSLRGLEDLPAPFCSCGGYHRAGAAARMKILKNALIRGLLCLLVSLEMRWIGSVR